MLTFPIKNDDGAILRRAGIIEDITERKLAENALREQDEFLGALLREIGEIEHSYLESARTLKQDWSYHKTEPGLDRSVSRRKSWYQKLDDEMKATVSAFSDDDLKKTAERGFQVSVEVQLGTIYVQALLIFLGKATICLKAMNRPLSKQIQDWIG